MERLAREKIAFQQRLSMLKKDLASQLDHIDVSAIPDDENETTTTASGIVSFIIFSLLINMLSIVFL